MYKLPNQNNLNGFTIEDMTNKYEFDMNRLDQRMRDRSVNVGTLAYLTKEKGRAVSTDMIYKLLKNERPNVSAEIVAVLADALDCSVDFLMGRTEKVAPISRLDMPADFLELWGIYERLTPSQRFRLMLQARLINDDLQGIVDAIATFGDVQSDEKVVAEWMDESVEGVQPQPVDYDVLDSRLFDVFYDVVLRRYGENEAAEVMKELGTSYPASMGASLRSIRRKKRLR